MTIYKHWHKMKKLNKFGRDLTIMKIGTKL